MGCGPLGSTRVWFNTALRPLLPPNVSPKTQERWQPPPVSLTGVTTAAPSLLGASLLLQIVGHDVLAMYVLGPGRTVHLPQTTLCCGVSGRPCCKPNCPAEPVSEVPIQASQELPLPMTLCFSTLGLTYSEPEDDLYEQFEFVSFFVCVFWMSMNMIISGHAERYLSCFLGLSWVLWSSLTQRLHCDLGSVDERDRVRRSGILCSGISENYDWWWKKCPLNTFTIVGTLRQKLFHCIFSPKLVYYVYFDTSDLITSPVRIASVSLLGPTWMARTATKVKRSTEEEGDRRRTSPRWLGLTPGS